MTVMRDGEGDQGQLAAMNYAGFWRRFGAALVDGVILTVAIGLIGLMLEAIGVTFWETVAVEATTEGGPEANVSVTLSGTGTVISIVVMWLYFALMESGPRQATPGKRLIGLRVTGLGGERIGFGRATGRHFAKYLSTILLMIGWIMAGFTARKQALHDMVAGCLVLARTR